MAFLLHFKFLLCWAVSRDCRRRRESAAEKSICTEYDGDDRYIASMMKGREEGAHFEIEVSVLVLQYFFFNFF